MFKIPLDVNSFKVRHIKLLRQLLGKFSYYVWSKNNPILLIYCNWTLNLDSYSSYALWSWMYIESNLENKTEWYSGTGLKDETNLPYNYETTISWNPCYLDLIDYRTKEKRSFSIELFKLFSARLSLHYFN
jgi:hypothetical protein